MGSSKILPIALASALLGLNPWATHQAGAASWVGTGSMHGNYLDHTATLLPNGKVLVAGGWGSGQGATSAELYDPETGTWTVTGSLHLARAGATATLLPNGKVLVAGSEARDGSYWPTTSAELYDPATGTWTLTGPMRYARLWHTATLLPDGKVLLAGGGSSICEVYNPAVGVWSQDSLVSINPLTATLLPNGKVLAALENYPAPYSAALYDPLARTWTPTGSRSNVYEDYSATLLPNGKVLVANGTAAELYDRDSGTWSGTGSPILDGGYNTATLLPNGKVLFTGANSRVADLYSPATGTWTRTASMRYARGRSTATLLPNGRVLVVGGDGPGVTSAELYVPDSDGAAPSFTILHNSNQILSFYWSGVGTLEQSDSLTAPNWQPAPIQDDPHTVSTTDPKKFFRVKAD